MNPQEFATISMAIKAAYPNANLMPDKQSKEVWYTMLADLDYKVCMSAVKEIISNNKFAPTIAEIREKCVGYTQLPIADWSEAWETVLRLIRKYGYMEEMQALESMDDITRTCVKRLGYQNICMSENIVADRANFRDIYEAEAKRRREQSKIPLQLQTQKQQMISQLIESTVKQIEKSKEPEPVIEQKTANMDHVNQLLQELRRNENGNS